MSLRPLPKIRKKIMSLKLFPLVARALLAMVCACGATAYAEDIDLFLKTAPNSVGRPNVLLVIDNAASNSSVITQLPNATGKNKLDMLRDVLDVLLNPLTSTHFPPFPACTVSGTTRVPEGCLTELETRQAALERIKKINLGLMIMNPSGDTTGGYVRYHIRSMAEDANRANLWARVHNGGTGIPKSNNAPYAKLMHEVHQYFGGLPAYAGFSNTALFDPGAKSGANYASPVTDDCQNNFVIFIGNGGPDSGEVNDTRTLLNGLGGILSSDPLPVSPSNYQSSWFDEYARTLNRKDVRPNLAGSQTIATYTIAVQSPADNNFNTRPMESARSLLQSAALAGGGEYALGQDGASVLRAINNALRKMQPEDSVFAAATLPVSVNVRGTFLNQVYMGQFRPDGNARPRWPGNLKQYQIALDANGNPILADRSGKAVEDKTFGFLLPDVTSFWTQDSTYWSFLSNVSSSDAPDGSAVEKGGAAQQLRRAFDTTAKQTNRNVFTCTGGGGSCGASGALLSSSPFNVGNSNITSTSLGITSANLIDPSSNVATERENLINWVRGANNRGDEMGNLTAGRAFVHGDVLHSRPAVINYNRTAGNRDIVVYYGGNDGLFRAVKGGQDNADGQEKWAMVFPEFFPKLKKLRDNNTVIDVGTPKPYFADGAVSVYQKDEGKDGRLVAADGDKVYLYVGMRRGGRFAYALDVSDPDTPKFLWKIDHTMTGFSEMGQTWSTLRPARIAASTDPVVIFGAGYDPVNEDPATATANTMGRGIFVVNAFTGALIKHIRPTSLADMGSVPADMTVLDRDGDGNADRIYAPDTKGNVWRVDIGSADTNSWAMHKIASLGGTGGDARKFLNKVDVVVGRTHDAVLVGSGDREHPLQDSSGNPVVDRFYMLKDTFIGPSGGLFCGTTSVPATCTHADLTDVTTTAVPLLPADSRGWYMTFATGEKLINSPLTVFDTVIFATNQPTANKPGICGNLGQARLYQIDFKTGSAINDLNLDGVINVNDRAEEVNGGGFLPSAVYSPVLIDGKRKEVVCVGPRCFDPAKKFGTQRRRTYWYTKQ